MQTLCQTPIFFAFCLFILFYIYISIGYIRYKIAFIDIFAVDTKQSSGKVQIHKPAFFRFFLTF